MWRRLINSVARDERPSRHLRAVSVLDRQQQPEPAYTSECLSYTSHTEGVPRGDGVRDLESSHHIKRHLS